MDESVDDPVDACVVSRSDVIGMIGVLATVEAIIAMDRMTDIAVTDLARRLMRDNLTTRATSAADVRAGLYALNERLRQALGENDDGPIAASS
jgi:hypothetical protein